MDCAHVRGIELQDSMHAALVGARPCVKTRSHKLCEAVLKSHTTLLAQQLCYSTWPCPAGCMPERKKSHCHAGCNSNLKSPSAGRLVRPGLGRNVVHLAVHRLVVHGAVVDAHLALHSHKGCQYCKKHDCMTVRAAHLSPAAAAAAAAALLVQAHRRHHLCVLLQQDCNMASNLARPACAVSQLFCSTPHSAQAGARQQRRRCPTRSSPACASSSARRRAW